jgi:EAL domain-containing protein (putative c-di-GMP-specific phosphodiesterase class I)
VRGQVPPDDFVPLAERTGLIEQLTRQVLNLALSQCSKWQEQGLDVSVAVNLSVRNLMDGRLPQQVQSLLEKWNVPPRKLELEITESSMMEDPERAKEILVALSSMGVRLTIDDFGTGHSSLAYLKRLPVSTIKIDKSFVQNMSSDENDFVIVQSTIDLAHNLGLEVIAEGVENEKTWTQLRQLGCDVGQGFWRGRPIRGEDIPYALQMIELPMENVPHGELVDRPRGPSPRVSSFGRR